MKNYIIVFCICLSAMKASSQTTTADMFPKGSDIYIKNGNKIASDKVDSVISSWGGRFSMQHDGNSIYLSPPSPEDIQRLKGLQSAPMANLNQPAADFSLTDINGQRVSLGSLRGKVVVLNFWFTTCAGCIAEIPDLNKLKKQYTGKKVIFLAIGRDDAKKIKGFVSSHEFNYQLLTNGVKTATDYKVLAFPTSMVIDQTGIVRRVQVSEDNIKNNLSSAIEKLL